MSKFLGLVLLLSLIAQNAFSEVQFKQLDYQYEGVTLKGFLAWDDAQAGKRPGILVVHEFWGLNDYARQRAKQLAGLGYVALAADMYGDGKTAAHPHEAMAMMNQVKENLPLWVGRATAGLKALSSQTQVDSKKLAVIGYCFGGATALQLAFSGADIRAAVSFHGSLPMPTEVSKIKASMLILHGGQDSFVPKESLEQLDSVLTAAKVPHKVVVYPHATHGFTVPEAGTHGMEGLKYDAEADKESWKEMTTLFKQLL